MRITRNEMFMAMASTVSLRGTCERAKVGCVIVRDGRIVSMGYNGSPPGALHCQAVPELCREDGCRNAIHAEANAVCWAARIGVSTEFASLYTTHAPCPACAQLVVAAGIAQVYYKHDYRLKGGLELLDRMNIPVWKTS